MLESNKQEHVSGREETAQRLLAAAERVFAAKGFEVASVRDITSAAGCNLAAVNYHFGGKENLYREVFRVRMRQMRDCRVAAIEGALSAPGATLEELLRAYAKAFLSPLMDRNDSRVLVALFSREMNDRCLPREMLVEEMIQPVQDVLVAAITRLCPNVEPSCVIPSIHSIVAQLLHLVRIRETFDEPNDLQMPIAQFDDLIEHIVRFSAAGIRAFAKEQGR